MMVSSMCALNVMKLVLIQRFTHRRFVVAPLSVACRLARLDRARLDTRGLFLPAPISRMVIISLCALNVTNVVPMQQHDDSFFSCARAISWRCGVDGHIAIPTIGSAKYDLIV
jgi:hypothetical protein